MTVPEESDAALQAEIAQHLAHARIALPPGRMAEVVREWRILKQQIGIVRRAGAGDAEPATVFAVTAPSPKSHRAG